MFGRENRLDEALKSALGRDAHTMVAHSARLPAYRFVDLHRAIQRTFPLFDKVSVIDAHSHELLTDLVHAPMQSHMSRTVVRADRQSWPVAAGKEDFFPNDGFWVLSDKPSTRRFAIRLRFEPYTRQSLIEVGACPPSGGEDFLQRLIDVSSANSIFRGKIINLGYEAGTKDEYGDVEKPEQLQVTFSGVKPVDAEEIVLSTEQIRLLERNMTDLESRRDILKKHGVPTKRGILLHGPPGTGKTYACRHICHRMPKTTRIFLTGNALNNVGAAFSLARLMQPSVVFVEDADLMFSSREINLYSSNLGEMMDQLDGLRPNEDVSVVMTTNAIDRMEGALKDRPGRISQCIFMGAPGRDLRRRFLRKQLENYDLTTVDLDDLVSASSGASQAFLTEWVFRSVQIGCEDLSDDTQPLALQTDHFLTALEEMQSNQDENANRIVGFNPNRNDK